MTQRLRDRDRPAHVFSVPVAVSVPSAPPSAKKRRLRGVDGPAPPKRTRSSCTRPKPCPHDNSPPVTAAKDAMEKMASAEEEELGVSVCFHAAACHVHGCGDRVVRVSAAV